MASQGSVGNVKFTVNGQTVTPTGSTIYNYFIINVNQSTVIYTDGNLWGVGTSVTDVFMYPPSQTVSEVVTELMSNYGFEDATY